MSRGTTTRNIRIDDELWRTAQDAASRRGDNLSDVIRERLREYVREPESIPRGAG